METVELEAPSIKTKTQINQNGYSDLGKYETIPALNSVVAEPESPAFDNMEDLIKYVHEHWDDD